MHNLHSNASHLTLLNDNPVPIRVKYLEFTFDLRSLRPWLSCVLVQPTAFTTAALFSPSYTTTTVDKEIVWRAERELWIYRLTDLVIGVSL